MAQIRVERERRVSPWVWLVVALVLIVAAVLLLDWAGYIRLPFSVRAAAEPATVLLASGTLLTREA